MYIKGPVFSERSATLGMDFWQRNHHFMRKLHSLTGVAPVGGYLLFHLWENFKAWQGPAAYNEVIAGIAALGWVLPLLEIFAIFLPLYFHALYGLYIVGDARYKTDTWGAYPYFRNWMFWLQRLSGVITLVFVTWHVWEFRLQKTLGVLDQVSFSVVQHSLANPINFWFYVIGIVAAVFHFANGLWSFCIVWGITVGPKAQRIMQAVTMAVFVLVSALGVGAVFAFRVVQ